MIRKKLCDNRVVTIVWKHNFSKAWRQGKKFGMFMEIQEVPKYVFKTYLVQYLPETMYNIVQVDKKIKLYNNNCYVIKNLIK